MSKSQDELVQEFLSRGGKIEILPPAPNTSSQSMSHISKQAVNLLSLEEAELLFGEKPDKKSKNPDFSNINMSLIPDHLKNFILSKFDNVITKEDE